MRWNGAPFEPFGARPCKALRSWKALEGPGKCRPFKPRKPSEVFKRYTV